MSGSIYRESFPILLAGLGLAGTTTTPLSLFAVLELSRQNSTSPTGGLFLVKLALPTNTDLAALVWS